MDFNSNDQTNNQNNGEYNSTDYYSSSQPMGDPNLQTQADPHSQAQQGYDRSQDYPYGQTQTYGQTQQGYGQPYNADSIYAQPAASNGKSLASMICGIIGLLTCCCYGVPGIILGIIAVVLANMAKNEIGTYDSMAKAGLIMGIIAIVLGALYIPCIILLGLLSAT